LFIVKTCPTCKAVYRDDDINYCLADGTTLIAKKGKTAEHSRWNDVAAIVFAALAVLVFLSLITNDPNDRAVFSTGNGTGVTRNWIGPLGANIASILINLFGWTSFLFPMLIALAALRVYQADTLVPRPLRIAGCVFFVVALSGLISLFGGYGAIVGEAAAEWTSYLIGRIGAMIFLAAVFISSVVLLTNVTVAGFMSNFELAWGNVKLRFQEWRARRRSAHLGDAEAAAQRARRRRKKRMGAEDEAPPTIVGGEPPPSLPTVIDTESVQSSPTFVEGPPENVEPAKPGYEMANDAPEDAEEAEDAPAAAYQDFANYRLPTSDMLTPSSARIEAKREVLIELSQEIERKSGELNVPGKVVNILPGPVVTTYEFKPDPGVKYNRVTGLVDDLCLALKAPSIRIDRIPGKAYVGIEVPNANREIIHLREVIESEKFRSSDGLLTLALGKTIDGMNYVADLAKMPHLLIAGATGSGKSVGVNTLVMSILYKARPDEVKFIMVDPKRLELGLYADIPHLAVPIITDPKRAANALKWAVSEMERRYRDLAGYGVRNISGYNAEAKRRNSLEQWDENGEPHKLLPYIVIIIDELADLMMVAGKEVEESITRLAQMARAVGIHLVLATQRPSVDVITGLIKANFPSRISFRVSSKVDSRTIIDANGAESLLGQGDMLFLPPGQSNVVRVHGAFADEEEIKKVVEFIKAQGRPEYDQTITKPPDEEESDGDLPGRRDPLFMEALKCVVQAKRGSTSLLQRHLRIGYGRAAAILDAMVREGYIGEMDGSTRARPVLPKAYEDLQDIAEGALGDEE
jgi:S-DNA-T family DNA segregation ATPase FtsK/SpoIIIE